MQSLSSSPSVSRVVLERRRTQNFNLGAQNLAAFHLQKYPDIELDEVYCSQNFNTHFSLNRNRIHTAIQIITDLTLQLIFQYLFIPVINIFYRTKFEANMSVSWANESVVHRMTDIRPQISCHLDYTLDAIVLVMEVYLLQHQEVHFPRELLWYRISDKVEKV